MFKGLGETSLLQYSSYRLDDRFCCWIVVFTFTATLGASLENDAVIFQEGMQEVRSPPPFSPHKAAHKSYHIGLNP